LHFKESEAKHASSENGSKKEKVEVLTVLGNVKSSIEKWKLLTAEMKGTMTVQAREAKRVIRSEEFPKACLSVVGIHT
jgi:hypothetical protein